MEVEKKKLFGTEMKDEHFEILSEELGTNSHPCIISLHFIPPIALQQCWMKPCACC
jgi:hypothetical protein